MHSPERLGSYGCLCLEEIGEGRLVVEMQVKGDLSEWGVRGG